MPKTIILPALTADFAGGAIEEWHKDVGDRIDIGDVIAEVSTDKAVVELESEHAGILGKILAAAGPDEVSVDAPIAVLLLDGETVGALEGFDPGADTVTDVSSTDNDSSNVDVPELVEIAEEIDVDKGDRVFASPVAIRIADQLDIDLTYVEGSGPDGRIVLGDVEAIAAIQDPPLQPAGTTSAPKTTIEPPPPGSFEKVPTDKIRTVIAHRLSEAKRDIPHFYLTVDCELDNLLGLRQRLNESANAASKISVNDIIIKACALALRNVPAANTAWVDDTLLRFTGVNVAVAVATPKGLITPVIFDADRKDLATISAECNELATRAREGRLQPEEYKGGGFTLSNLGMYGVREFSAIINPPQACILAVGAGERRAVVKQDEIVVATVMTCTLSADHRAIDGALGAEFLQSISNFIEQPELMLG